MPHYGRSRLALAAILLCTLLDGLAMPAWAQQPAAPPPLRPYRIADESAMEGIQTESFTFAPDGQAVAFVRLRPTNSQIVNSMVIEETRADVWLQEAPRRPVRNLTQGQADSSGWWWPQWSPDGRRLAMLSSRGGEVTLWVWERATNQVRQLSKQGMDFVATDGYRWVDAHRLLALVPPEGEVATPLGDLSHRPGKYAELTINAWAKAMRGEVTASAVSSLAFPLPQRRLFLLDVRAGSGDVLAATQLGGVVGEFPSWWLSPDGRAVAFRRPLPAKYPRAQRWPLGSPASLELRWLDGRPVRLDRSLPDNVVTTSLRWSPDGKVLAFFAYENAPINPLQLYGEGASAVVVSAEERAAPLLKHPARLWRVEVERGRVTPWELGDLDLGPSPETLAASLNPDRRKGQPSRIEPLRLPAFEWTTGGELVFRVPRRMKADSAWIVLGRNGRTRPGADRLTAAFKAESLTIAAQQRFERRVTPPVPGAKVVAVSPTGQGALYLAEDRRRGTFLWRVAPSGQAQLLVSANTFLKTVVYGEPRLFDYTTLDGESMKAYLLLPPGYTPGRRYPLVVDSDIGYEAAAAEGYYALAKSGDRIVGREFAAGGYVYMFASMPTMTTMDPVGRANLLLLTHGLLPAVDKAIELGYADPDRLFLYGASSMGYGVYGLVTQTPRFRAAVTQCGWTDMITRGLLRSELTRYAEWHFDSVNPTVMYSYFQLPFWRNADHRRRNSPLNYVDRVQTPLMIIKGDLDYVPITDSEMFFAALIQQRKPAEFVRYWGEGHAIRNPRNFADYHQRMFAWFDQWGDISRDAHGHLIFEQGRVKSRGGQPALKPEAYAQFAAFGPGGEQAGATSKAETEGASH